MHKTPSTHCGPFFFSRSERTLSDSKSTVKDEKKNASGRTTPEPHFHAKRQISFYVKPVLVAKLRLLPTGRNEAHHLQTFLNLRLK